MSTHTIDQTAAASTMTWRTVLRWGAVAGIVELVITMAVVEKDFIPPVAVIAILLLAGTLRLRSDDAGQ